MLCQLSSWKTYPLPLVVGSKPKKWFLYLTKCVSTHRRSLGTGESHDTRLSAGSLGARGSGTSILTRSSLVEQSKIQLNNPGGDCMINESCWGWEGTCYRSFNYSPGFKQKGGGAARWFLSLKMCTYRRSNFPLRPGIPGTSGQALSEKETQSPDESHLRADFRGASGRSRCSADLNVCEVTFAAAAHNQLCAGSFCPARGDRTERWALV